MKSRLSIVKYVIGLSLAFLAVSNCFSVLSSSSTFSIDNASNIEQATRGQYNVDRLSLAGPNLSGDLLNANRSREAATRAGLVTRTVSALANPFAPTITATKSHMLAPGDTQADPGDTVTYTIVITNSGTSDATDVNFSDTIDPNTTLVPGSVIVSPIAVNDSYNTIGNVNISVPVAQGVIANDTNPNGGGTLTVTQVNATAVPGGGSATAATPNGSVTMSSDGSFTYTPNVAFRGPSDGFTYTLGNGTGKFDTASVTINISGLIWFVDTSAAPGGDGRLSTPFNCLVGAGCFDPAAADAANDNIFLYSGAYSGGLTLLSGQKFIGQGAGQSLLTITALAAPSGVNLLPSTGGTNPTVTSSTNGVNVGPNNQIWGVTFGNSTGADIDGAGFGTLKVRDTTLNGNGQALNLSTGTLDAIFQSISSINSATTGVTLNTVGGTLTSPSTTITNPAGIGIDVQSTPPAAVHNFGNTTSTQSGGTGVSLLNNTGNITFSVLDITPDSGQRAFHATGNTGTLTCTSGTVSTTANTAVEIVGPSNASRTPLNMVLTGVSTSSAPPNGILLTNVAGTGFTSNGGTINGTTGADGANAGIGVRLENANAITLSGMSISGTHQNFGIRGLNVNGLTMTNTNVTGIMGTSVALHEAAVSFTDLLGSDSVTGGTINGGVEDNFRVVNSSGSLNRLTVSGTTFGANNTATGDDSLFIQAAGTSTVNVTVQNSFLTAARGDLIQTDVIGTGHLDLIFTGNALSNNHANIVSGGGGTTFSCAASSGATFTYDIDGNTFKDADGAALAVSGGNPNVTTSGTIQNNIIGLAGTANSGSKSGSGIAWVINGGGTHSVNMDSNQVRQYNNHGILLQIGLAGGAATNANVSVTTNTVQTPGNINSEFNAILLNHGLVGADSFTSCVNIGGAGALKNIVNGGGSGVVSPNNNDIRLRQRQATTVRLPGYAGANNDNTAVQNFIAAQNTLTTVNAANTVPTGGGYIGGAACSVPSLMLGPIAESLSFSTQAAKPEGDAKHQKPIFMDILLAPEVASGAKDVKAINRGDLQAIIQAAIARLESLGVPREDIARLESVTFDVAKLRDDQLVVTTPTMIIVDETAADYGWFVDQSPDSHTEFKAASGNWLKAKASSPAADRMDLFTAISRALDYVLEHDWTKRSLNRYSLNERVLEPGTRRVPVGPIVRPAPLPEPIEHVSPVGQISKAASAPAEVISQNTQPVTSANSGLANTTDQGPRPVESLIGQIAATADLPNATSSTPPLLLRHAVFNPTEKLKPGSYAQSAKLMSYAAGAARVVAASPAPFSGETVTKSIGTIPPGESVTIMFQVTIDSPFPPGVCTITNQGHVTGSNFSQVDTNSDVITVVAPVAIGACPADITTNTDAGLCTAVVTYSTPTATGCPTATVTCNPASNTAFPKGTTTVTCTATNGTPPDSTCTFTVTVKDTEAPTCNLPANITQSNDPGQCSATVSYTATASDNCPGASIVCNPASGSTFPKGTTTVNCTASDTSADSPDTSCSFTVTVNDTQPPTIGACPSPIVTGTNPGLCSAVVTYATPSASDNCPGVTVGCSPSSGTAFPKGVTTVTCTATDTSSLTASCSFTVTVIDNQPPSITCPGNINATEDSPGSGCATVTYTTPTPSDNCPGATASCTPPSGTCFPIGATTVTCTAMDTSANSSSCQFTVTVTAIGLTELSPAKLWIGLKNSDDVGTKFDLLAEVLKNGSVVGSGQLNDVPGGSSGFNNGVLRTIILGLSSPVAMGPGDTMSFRLSVRIGATSGHTSGTVRLWYNGAAIDSGASRDAGSRFDATIAGSTSDYFLRSPGFTLNTTAGSSRVSVDKLANHAGGNPWQVVGTWNKTF